MSASSQFGSYQFNNLNEYCLRMGQDHARQIMLIPPLFEEANRMRRFLAQVMRRLDAAGVGSMLPDLPGSNESLAPLADASLTKWQDALNACAEQSDGPLYIASFRGGALIDTILPDRPHWRFSPAKGSTLLRTMMRTRIASDKENGVVTTMDVLNAEAQSSPIELAGNMLGPDMVSELATATPAPLNNLRTIRLSNDSQASDLQVEGKTLWLRAEPDEDTELANKIATDLAERSAV